MSELATQLYLWNGGTLEELCTRYKVDAKRHPNFPNLVLLKYGRDDPPFQEPIVRECRGLILDEKHNWAVVAMGLEKFFNLHEPLATKIDWARAVVQEKIDGSFALLYSYAGSWHVATTGTPDAGGDINGFRTTFQELFWNTYEYDLPNTRCGLCFFFELCSPLSRVVVEHKQPKLVLLGARDLNHLREISPSLASSYIPGCPVVRQFDFDNVDAVVAAAKDMNGLEQEGFVICDPNSGYRSFPRVKIKSPSYLLLHHAKDGFQSQRSFVEVAIKGEAPEIIAAFPEYKEKLDEANNKIALLIKDLEESYEKIKHIEGQRDFAYEALKTRCSGALFTVRAGKAKNFREYLQGIHVDNLMLILGYR